MIYELVLILIVLYIIGVVLSSVLYNDLPENVLKRHISKWSAIILGLIVAIALSYFIGEYMLILPLLIILILSTIWVIVYRPKFPLAAKPASA